MTRPAAGTTGELRWGILGCGHISGDFSQALTLFGQENSVITAVATSDSLERAENFLRRYSLHEHFGTRVRAYGSYKQLLADADVDVVYVGALNHQHKAVVLAALTAGKHVLCEKPMGLNAKEVEEMVALARRQRLFLMEAYWSRFFPAWEDIPQALREIGGPVCVVADFGCAIHAVNKTELCCGGGYLLATGCYLPMLASWVFGSANADGKMKRPTKVSAVGQLGEKGTDLWANVTLEYDGGTKQAALFYTGLTATPCSASISGPRGSVHMAHDFWSATHICVAQQPQQAEGHTMEKGIETRDFPLPTQKRAGAMVPWAFDHGKAPGMAYEADHVYRCIKDGKLESAVMSLEESIILAEISDEVRRQLGVRFPQDAH